MRSFESKTKNETKRKKTKTQNSNAADDFGWETDKYGQEKKANDEEEDKNEFQWLMFNQVEKCSYMAN